MNKQLCERMRWWGTAKERKEEEVLMRWEREKFFFFNECKDQTEKTERKASKRIKGIVEYESC